MEKKALAILAQLSAWFLPYGASINGIMTVN